jgi:poly-gamma-glutamate capsule biosynthesis protein CapA/YwtB (metallophosphatase superfamily)
MTGRLLSTLLLTHSLVAQITVTAVGDTRITPRLLADLPPIHLQGDLVFANFEGVLAEPASPDPWKFCMPPRVVEALAAMGINSVNLANNHSLDMGPDARRGTAAALAQRFAVAGPEGEEGFMTLRGIGVRVVGFSFSGPNGVNHLEAIAARIRRRTGEIVIVSAHMGGENRFSQRVPFETETFGKEKRGDVVAFSHRAIDAGADLVLGHGPHVPRGIELYKNKLIVYSLGNFLFDYPGATLNAHAPGYAITVSLDGNGDFLSARIASYDLQYGVPRPDAAERAYQLIRYLTLDNLRQRNFAFPGGGVIEKCKN